MELAITMTATLAAFIAAVAGIATFILALTRRARLRHQEALWRQILDSKSSALTRTQLKQLRELQRDTTAHLISYELVPNTFLITAVWTVVICILVAIGSVGWTVGARLTGPPESHWEGYFKDTASMVTAIYVILCIQLTQIPLGAACLIIKAHYAKRSQMTRRLLEQPETEPESPLGYRSLRAAVISGLILALAAFQLAASIPIYVAMYSGRMDTRLYDLPMWVPSWVEIPSTWFNTTILASPALTLLHIVGGTTLFVVTLSVLIAAGRYRAHKISGPEAPR